MSIISSESLRNEVHEKPPKESGATLEDDLLLRGGGREGAEGGVQEKGPSRCEGDHIIIQTRQHSLNPDPPEHYVNNAGRL